MLFVSETRLHSGGKSKPAGSLSHTLCPLFPCRPAPFPHTVSSSLTLGFLLLLLFKTFKFPSLQKARMSSYPVKWKRGGYMYVFARVPCKQSTKKLSLCLFDFTVNVLNTQLIAQLRSYYPLSGSGYLSCNHDCI